MIFLSFVFYLMNNKLSNAFVSEINSEDSYFQKMNDELNSRLSGSQIDNIICMDSVQNTFLLSEIMEHKSTLFFYFSEYNCNTCFEGEIRLLQSFYTNGHFHVIILCAFELEDSFKIFLTINQVHVPIYRVKQEALKLQLDDYGYPYYFLLNPELIVSDIYIPNKSSPELNKIYLEKIKKYFSMIIRIMSIKKCT
jgi:hypothetical protein